MTHEQHINAALENSKFTNVIVEQIGRSTDCAIIQNGERIGLFDACRMEFVDSERVSNALASFIWDASKAFRDSL